MPNLTPTQILSKLKSHYPTVKGALVHRNAFELLIATILSAQCTDKQVNLVTPVLFAKFPTPLDLAEGDIEEIKKIIHSTGFYNAKARNIQNCAKKLVADFKSEVPDSIEKLITLPGVARKTANVVLSQWFKKAEGITVDTHVKRLSKLLGLTKHEDPVKIEQDLMKIFPESEWMYIGLALVTYGRQICPAKKHDNSKCWLKH